MRIHVGMRSRLRKAACCGLLWLGVFATPAMAQIRPDLRTELERTEQLLQRAAEVVRISTNPRAGEQLHFAQQLQVTAWTAFDGHMPQRAFNLTMQAREAAQRAIFIARQQGDLEATARHALEATAQLLARAREHAGDSPPERVQRVLELATSRLEQANEAFHVQRFGIALELARSVRQMLEEVTASMPMHRVERLLESTHQLLDRAAPGIQASGDRVALGLLDRARSLLQQADTQRQTGNADAARALAMEAKELLLRAMRMTERPPESAAVDRALQDAARYIEGLARQVRASGSAEAVTLMDRAVQHLERARELRQKGALRQALAEARVARNLAHRAGELAGVHEL